MRKSGALILLVAAGCDSSPPSSIYSVPEPMLIARVTGAVSADIRGTAFFQLSGFTGSRHVTVLAHERALPGDLLQLKWFGTESDMPTKGTYDITTPELALGGTSGFYALYETAKGTKQGFVSYSGRLTLTASDASRIAGSFRFQARRYCQYDGGPCHPSDATPTSPEVTVEGSFVAPPIRSAAASMMLRPPAPLPLSVRH